MIRQKCPWAGFAVAVLILSAGLVRCPSAAEAAESPLDLDSIRLPDGYHISIFASHVPGVRSLAISPEGTIFAGTLSEGKVYALRDLNGDQQVDEVLVVDEGLILPSGVAFRSGDLYVAEGSRILLYAEIEERLYDSPEPIVVSNPFPADNFHGWHTIAFGPDGKLYASIGAPCNACESADPLFATIVRMGRGGEEIEIVARGVRSAGGLAWHPENGDLYFTEAGRVWMGDQIPSDELNRSGGEGFHFGFPFCHGTDLPDPELGEGVDCDQFTSPAAELGSHVGPFGLAFGRGTNFPDRQRNSLFIAERGSLVGSDPAGFRLTTLSLSEEGEPVYEEFATGWLREGEILGRPTDLVVTAEGDLLLSDEYRGVIYRISFEESRTKKDE